MISILRSRFAWLSFRNYALRTKFMVTFLLILVVVFTLLGGVIITARQVLIIEANESLYSAASQMAANLDAFVAANLRAVHMASSFPEMQDLLFLPPSERAESPEQEAVLSTLLVLTQYPWDQFTVLSYALLDETGRNVADTVPSYIGRDESGLAFFDRVLTEGLPYASPVIFSDAGVHVYFAAPIRRDVRGGIIGVLRMQFALSTVQNLILEGQGLSGTSSHAIVLDEYHVRLADNVVPEMLFRTTRTLSSSTVEMLEHLNRLPAQPVQEMTVALPDFEAGVTAWYKDPFFTAATYPEGPVAQAAVVPMENTNWLIVFIQDRDVFLAPIDARIRETLLVGLMMLVAGMVIAAAMARWITRPILQLTASVEQISGGNLFTEVPVYSQDEVGRLGSAFNDMTVRLQRSLSELEFQMLAIGRQQQQSEAILDNIDDGIVLATADGMITYVNPAFTTLTGYAGEDVTGRPLTLLHADLDPQRVISQAAVQGSRSWNRELVVQGLSGVAIEVEVAVVMVQDRLQQVESLVVSLRDIGRLKHLDRMKSFFMRHISHELRTPLTSIRLYMRLLRSGRAEERREEYLDVLESETFRLSQLTEKVIDATRFANPAAMNDWQLLSLRQIIDMATAQYATIAQHAELDFAVTYPPADVRILGDAAWLLRALTELLDNAVTYTPGGGHIQLDASVMVTDPEKPMVCVAVTDTGMGIATEELGRILDDDFYRGAVGESAFVPGIGLGLTIVRLIVEQHGGSLRAESTGVKGEGCTFYISLPVAPEPVESQPGVSEIA